jgi:hypothetical protein
MDDQPVGPGAALFDTSGRRIKDGVVQHEAGLPAALRAAFDPAEAGLVPAAPAEAETATACFELHSGPSVIQIQVTADLLTNNPYNVLGGTLTGDICTGPGPGLPWQVTFGQFGESLRIFGERAPVDPSESAEAEVVGSCANFIAILGFYRTPDSYPGVFGFNGALLDFYHNTLFKGWQACS